MSTEAPLLLRATESCSDQLLVGSVRLSGWAWQCSRSPRLRREIIIGCATIAKLRGRPPIRIDAKCRFIWSNSDSNSGGENYHWRRVYQAEAISSALLAAAQAGLATTADGQHMFATVARDSSLLLVCHSDTNPMVRKHSVTGRH